MPLDGAALSTYLQQQQCQSIYNALDSRQYRQAIQQADTLLRNPSAKTAWPLAKALRALALFHNHQNAEAITDAESVAALGATDLAILSPAEHVLSELGRKAQAAEMIEAAAKVRVDNLELQTKAFGAFLAVPDYLKAQQVAGRMHKTFGEPSKTNAKAGAGKGQSPARCSSSRNRYFWWSIQAYLLLARETPKAQGAALASTLAERMIQKHIDTPDGALDGRSDEDLKLYIRVLLHQAGQTSKADDKGKKRADAVQLLSSEPGCSIVGKNLSLSQLKMDILEQSGRYDELEAETRKHIQNGDRNWVTIEKWICSAVKIAQADTTSRAKFESFAEELVSKDSRARDYPLARLTLAHELRKASLGTSEGFIALLSRYIETFGRKLACYDDVLPILDSLSSEEVKELLTSVPESGASSKSGDKLDTEEQVIRLLNSSKINARLAEPAAEDAWPAIEGQLSSFYASLPSASKQPKTVPRAGTDFILIASQMILTQDSSAATLVELLSIHTHAANASPASYALKLLCLRVYLLLDCHKDARRVWTDLKIRAIQNESLGWLWVGRHSSERTDEPPLFDWINGARRIYAEHEGESHRLVMSAFERGNYANVAEFIEFRHRLERSVQRLALDLEDAKEQALVESDGKAAKETVQSVLQSAAETISAGLYDQWDYSVLPSFCNKSLPSLTRLTGRGWDESLLVARRYINLWARYLALLVDCDLPSVFGCPPDDAATNRPTSLTEAEVHFDSILISLSNETTTTTSSSSSSSTSLDTSLSNFLAHVRPLLPSSEDPSSPSSSSHLLPWQQRQHASLLWDLYTLFSRLASRNTAAAAAASTTTTVVVDEATVQRVREAHREYITWLSQRPSSSLLSTPGTSSSSSLSAKLQGFLEGQKGGKGVREKIVKDVRENVAKRNRELVASFESA